MKVWEERKMCDTCKGKEKCPFYEKGAEECVYEALAEMALNTKLEKGGRKCITNPRKI